jgi:hypothetical protein
MTNPMMTANETARAISERTPCQRPNATTARANSATNTRIGRVGGVEADNLAVYQPRLDLDAGGAGQARVSLLHGTCWTWVRVALTSRVGSS